MNILVFSWRDPKHPLAGGAEQVMHEHMKGWFESGHSVTLFASYFKGGARREELDGVSIIRSGFQYLGVHIAGFIWYLFGKHKKFNLVVDQFHGIPFFTPLYVRVPKLAVLQEVAKEVWLLNHFPRPFNWIIGWAGYIFEPFIFLAYRKTPFMVGSLSAEDDLIKFGILASRITVVPHGVLVTKPPKDIKKEKIPTIAFLGALTKDKGVEDAIKCFSILDQEGEFQFWIIGKGDSSYTQYLKNLAKNSIKRNEVTFFGFVPEEKKFQLLARSYILINPSIREGWGLVNIEANTVGTPVVAYHSPGLVDSVKDGMSGVLCKDNSPENLAENVSNLISDKKGYEKLQKGAISWSQNFSWNKSRKMSLQLIAKITNEKNL